MPGQPRWWGVKPSNGTIDLVREGELCRSDNVATCLVQVGCAAIDCLDPVNLGIDVPKEG
jgi:hypothetical protein